MSSAPVRCVVDASVGIKLYIAEPLSERTDELFRQLATDPAAELVVPDLFYIECANILWKHVRRTGLPAARARQAVAELAKLGLRRVSTLELIADALDIALSQSITAYDACYVALAHRLGMPFVTADERLARLLAGTAYRVHWLSDFPIPRAA
jgi:predicted nucleic acid-binding protein